MSARKKKGANKAFVPEDVQIGDMAFWRSLAGQVVPLEGEDKWRLSERATLLQEICDALSTEWKRISSICEKNEDKTIAFSVACEIDRRTGPAEVSVRIGYGQKFSRTIKKKVADPDQSELPLEPTPETSGEPPPPQD